MNRFCNLLLLATLQLALSVQTHEQEITEQLSTEINRNHIQTLLLPVGHIINSMHIEPSLKGRLITWIINTTNAASTSMANFTNYVESQFRKSCNRYP